jgi:hypothetical protein
VSVVSIYLDIEKGYKLGYIWGQKRRRVERLGREALFNQDTIARNRGARRIWYQERGCRSKRDDGRRYRGGNTTGTKPEVVRVQGVARLGVFFDEGQV